MSTESEWYAERLASQQGKRWKQLLRVQAPYQWNLRRQELGRCLDVGCGIGRNLSSLAVGSVGVDHNVQAVAVARRDGFEALTVEEFHNSGFAESSFDGLLLAHVIEHMPFEESVALVSQYLPYLRPGGKVFMICPQERGYASDPTHVAWTTGKELVALCQQLGLVPEKPKSFPFPRALGKWFIYNEFTLMARKA